MTREQAVIYVNKITGYDNHRWGITNGYLYSHFVMDIIEEVIESISTSGLEYNIYGENRIEIEMEDIVNHKSKVRNDKIDKILNG